MKSKSKIIRVLLIEDNPGDARLIKEALGTGTRNTPMDTDGRLWIGDCGISKYEYGKNGKNPWIS